MVTKKLGQINTPLPKDFSFTISLCIEHRNHATRNFHKTIDDYATITTKVEIYKIQKYGKFTNILCRVCYSCCSCVLKVQ